MDGAEVDFEKLIQLQELDNSLRQITAELSDIPKLIKQIEEKIKADSELVAISKEKLSQNQKKRRELESEVKDLKTQIAKFKHQLNEVKTNREYTSLVKEIQDTQFRVDRLEEEIIKELLAADDIEEEVRTANLKQKNDQEHLRQEIEALNQRKKTLEEEKSQLLKQKEELVRLIPHSQFQLYQSIAKKRGGIALSRIKDEFCSICQLRIRPQMLNEVRDCSKIHLCESCGRILYIDLSEESGEETEGSSR
ncbi:MAG: C4-type zinc ribbon domain-containing protein [Acidobacteriota bacterium]|nr:C4-type zinc ribbon domain-containing protein [Acidobacteriota bacterium]MDW3228832.1 C4-type zinc ribbon domain-containing protein [Acidobacteriota bacterium]MDY0231557.1 C4-type zinc ribbon domain-containing protein [Candidatus Saccharicenans sp.]